MYACRVLARVFDAPRQPSTYAWLVSEVQGLTTGYISEAPKVVSQAGESLAHDSVVQLLLWRAADVLL